MSQLPDNVSAVLPSAETNRRRLRRVRSQHRPKDPASLDELIVEGSWAQTTGPNPQPFLPYDNDSQTAKRLLIFSTTENLQLLAQSESLFMDGTFGVAPSMFAQLYVIHGQVGVMQCPLVYALMERQTQSSYEELFRFIIDQCDAAPMNISVDFEQAAHHAICSVFGDNVTLRGCFYHLTQSTWRKIQNLGLSELYKTDDTFRLFCGQLDALALLPLASVYAGMAYLRGIMPAAAEELVDYFDATYVSGSLRRCPLRRTGSQLRDTGLRLRLTRRRPIFSPTVWNCHETTLNDDARTNNVCEGWNNSVARLVGHDHPSIWKLIETLQSDVARVHVLVLQES